MVQDEQAPEKLVGALVNGLNVLGYLSACSQPVGASRVARDLALNPSTCFNLLKTLVHQGLVMFDDASKTYSVGLGLLALARGVLEQNRYVVMARPYLRRIALDHGVTCTLWHVTSGERVVLVDRADNDAAIRVHMSIGQRLPMYVAALGRCMAVHSGLDAAELRARFANLRWQAPLTFKDYMRQVDEARELGYAVDSGNFVKGVTTVSTAVLDADGRPLMAISSVGIAAQLNKGAVESLGEDMRVVARRLSSAISGKVAAGH